MKKFILILTALFMFGLCAQSMEVHYMGGRPAYISTPYGRTSINNFGSNAAFLPHNTAAAGARIRAREFAKLRAQSGMMRAPRRYARPYGRRYSNMSYPVQTSVNITPVSRFDKNYQISTNRKSYTRNGITYFD